MASTITTVTSIHFKYPSKSNLLGKGTANGQVGGAGAVHRGKEHSQACPSAASTAPKTPSTENAEESSHHPQFEPVVSRARN